MSLLRTVHLHQLSDADRALLFQRRQPLDEIVPAVREIMESVRQEGDEAVRRYTERFDGIRPARFEVSAGELAEARAGLEPRVLAALKAEIEAVRKFHVTQLPKSTPVETTPGVWVWREWRPIEKVGLYVPGGRGPYPSSVVMLGVPAAIAGCPEIVLCTPPGPDGAVPRATLAAAHLAGIHRVFKVGGAQAIAAMTYGTGTVPAVDKLFGAGNAYVTAAKLLAFPRCSLDSPAGPSELLILAERGARPDWIAADLISDAEHGPDSPAVLVTPSRQLAGDVAREVERQIASLPRREIAEAALASWGLIVVTETLEEAVGVANDYAAEHLEIMTDDPRATLSHIRHAGSIFLGPFAPNAAGDYATGTNHVLPTSRYARTFAPVSVESFGRMVQCQEVSREGLAALRPTVGTLAREEGLEGHARAVESRFTGDAV